MRGTYHILPKLESLEGVPKATVLVRMVSGVSCAPPAANHCTSKANAAWTFFRFQIPKGTNALAQYLLRLYCVVGLF